MLIPDESQNLVSVMSAMTVVTPGVNAAQSSSPTRPALEMSISAGKVTTTALTRLGCRGSRISSSPPMNQAAMSRPALMANRPKIGWQLPSRRPATRPAPDMPNGGAIPVPIPRRDEERRSGWSAAPRIAPGR